jgi:ribonuclease Y
MAIIAYIVAIAAGVAAGYFWRNSIAAKSAGSVEQRAEKKLEEAELSAKNIVVEAKEKAANLLTEWEKDERRRKLQLESVEDRVMKREETLDKKIAGLELQEAALSSRTDQFKIREDELEAMRKKTASALEDLSGLSREEAKEALLKEIRDKSSDDMAATLQKMFKERQDTIEKQALDVITVSLQRYARSHVSEMTTTLFPLTDDELKGKIIGREGRNIRAIERATGCELIIDETPDSIIVSSFDPFRREVARLTLEKLIKDGRIQPAKIEEKAEEAKQDLQKRMLEIGEQSAQEVGVYDLPKEILQLLGRLHFRTSFGQNVLTHSVEMAHIASMMAAELGLNVAVTKKGALLHDIGKAIDHEVEGTHVELGRKILKKYNIEEKVIEAMQSHHDDYPYAIPEAYVVTAADVLSAARPGARRGTLENYIKRLGDLEKIAMDFNGVKMAYAISAGRELRVFVVPEKIDDFKALELAREIANRVQSELRYPGEIKVNIIREMRAVEYAR